MGRGSQVRSGWKADMPPSLDAEPLLHARHVKCRSFESERAAKISHAIRIQGNERDAPLACWRVGPFLSRFYFRELGGVRLVTSAVG